MVSIFLLLKRFLLAVIIKFAVEKALSLFIEVGSIVSKVSNSLRSIGPIDIVFENSETSFSIEPPAFVNNGCVEAIKRSLSESV